jgi:hypothetical protein
MSTGALFFLACPQCGTTVPITSDYPTAEAKLAEHTKANAKKKPPHVPTLERKSWR